MNAFVSDGRWVAFCGDPDCGGAEQDWGQIRHKDDGTPFGIVGGVLWCGNCGQQFPVDFPPDRDRITEILAARPVPETRNWHPGETISDLIEENAAHGVD